MAKKPKKTKKTKPAAAPARKRLGYVGVGLLAAAAVAAMLLLRETPEIPAPETSAMEPQVAEKIAETRGRVEGDIRSAEAWSTLGAVFQARELFPEAAASYAQARALDPEDYRWPYLEAQCLKEIRARGSAGGGRGSRCKKRTLRTALRAPSRAFRAGRCERGRAPRLSTSARDRPALRAGGVRCGAVPPRRG